MLQKFYPHLLAFHGLLRWIVLAAAVAAIFVALSGWSGTKPASTNLGRFSIIFVIAMDIELLTGLLLYFGASPITRAALANIGEAMKYRSRAFSQWNIPCSCFWPSFAHTSAELCRAKLGPI